MTYLVGQTVEMDGWGMFKFMLLVTLLPVVIGSAANMLLHKKHWFEDVRAIMPAVAVAAFACIVGGVAAVHGHRFAEICLSYGARHAAHNIGGLHPRLLQRRANRYEHRQKTYHRYRSRRTKRRSRHGSERQILPG